LVTEELLTESIRQIFHTKTRAGQAINSPIKGIDTFKHRVIDTSDFNNLFLK